jgi:hypothetical protein
MDARGGYEQSSCLSGGSAILRGAPQRPPNSDMIPCPFGRRLEPIRRLSRRTM